MLKRLMILGGMLTMLLVLAAPALAQGVESETNYDPAPDAIITGVIQTTPNPEEEGSTHTITEDATGDEYGLFSNLQGGGVDLSQYVGQRVTITGYFQTEGTGTEGYVLTDLLIYVESVEVLDEGPATDDQYKPGPTTEDPAEGQYETDAPAGDQYEGGAVEDGAVEDSSSGDGESSGGILSVLPDTGGYSLAALGLISLLLLGGGGLLSYSLIRR